MKEPRRFTCPACRAPLTEAPGRFFPFCSERCALVDLGRWADGAYVVEADETAGPENADAVIGPEIAGAGPQLEEPGAGFQSEEAGTHFRS